MPRPIQGTWLQWVFAWLPAGLGPRKWLDIVRGLAYRLSFSNPRINQTKDFEVHHVPFVFGNKVCRAAVCYHSCSYDRNIWWIPTYRPMNQHHFKNCRSGMVEIIRNRWGWCRWHWLWCITYMVWIRLCLTSSKRNIFPLEIWKASECGKKTRGTYKQHPVSFPACGNKVIHNKALRVVVLPRITNVMLFAVASW